MKGLHFAGGRRPGRCGARFLLVALLLWLPAAAPAQSTDATLKGLTAGSASSETGTYFLLNIGTFAATTTTYTATVPFARTHVKLTPTVNESNATVGVRKGSTGTFASVDSGSQSAAIALDVGSNAITVRVTAQDTTTTKDYTVTITRQSAPAPAGFRVLPGNAAFTAEWQPVAGANSYKIEWDARAASGFGRSATATPGTARRKAIQHSSTNAVVNGSAYKVRVSACAGADGSTGCGAATAAQTVTPGTPGRIHSFSIGPGWVMNGKNTLEVTWYPVAANASPVIGYDVHYTTTWYVGGDAEPANTYIYGTMYERMPDPSEGWVRIVRWGPGGELPHTTTAHRETIVNVEVGVHYRVRIRAVNAVGPGPWKHTGYGIPGRVSAPNVPGNVRLEPGDGKLTLRWEAPGSWGAWPAGGYEILWKRTSAGAQCPVVGDSRETAACAAFWKPVWKNGSRAVIGPGETSFVFTGAQHGSETVTNGTSYDLRIRGWNKRPGTDGSAGKDRRATPVWYPARISGTPTNTPVVPESPGTDRSADTRPLLETCAAYLPSNAVSVSEVTGWRDEHPHLTAHVLRWNQVLEALGEDTGTSPMTVHESRANEGRWSRSRWSRVTATLDAVDRCAAAIITAASDQTETASAPTVLLSGPAQPVAEGSPARITVTLSAALDADVTVPLTVTRDGSEPEDHGTLAGITVPAGFTSATAEIATNQDDDSDDERFIVALGALPAGLQPGSRTSVAVTIADDDTQQAAGYTVPAELVRTVRHYYESNRNKPSRGENWFRVLIAFGVETHATLRPFTAAEAEVEATKWSGWQPVLDALRKLEAAQGPPPAASPTPEVSIAAGPAVTEGQSATFTVTSSPAPAAPLTVAVTVTESGGYAAAGTRTVTVPTSGTATFTVATVDDTTDEPDGSVTATLAAGSGYTVSSSRGGATVAVADDDEPVVSIAAGPAVTEGSDAAFTLTAAPAPAADLSVSVTVSQSGAFGAALGARTVTIAAGTASAAFTVATVDDTVHEPDGSVTATLAAGSGYTVSSSQGAATVAVADDDEVALPAFMPKRGIAREGSDGAVVFALRLSHASTQAVTVDWTTADGAGPWAGRVLPATAGADYVAASGTLTFAPGETQGTVSVALLDDAIDEGMEYFLLRFSNLRGASMAARDREVEGIIRNDDHLQAMWLSRFGRTVGSQVTEAVSQRLEGGLAPGAHATLAGQPLDLSRDGAVAALAGLAQDDGALAGRRESPAAVARPLTGREVLLGSAFHLATEGRGPGPGLAAWGRVAQGHFDGVQAGDAGSTRVDSEVTTGVLGVDAQWGRLLAGLAVGLSEGAGAFASPGVDRGQSGSIDSRLTTLSPYARFRLTERVSAWGLVGWGTGDMTIGFDDGAMAPVHTDLRLAMGALGARGALLEQRAAAGMDLALRTDAFYVQTRADAAVNTVETQADATRLRLVLEGGRAFALSDTSALRLSLELGVRHDGGDAETGAGVEVGGGVSYVNTALGLSIEAQVRMLAAHAESAYDEWGASATARLDPGERGRGLSFALSPAVGVAASDGLWGARDARAWAPVGAAFAAAQGLHAEAGYGFTMLGGRLTGTPNVGVGMADGGARAYRVGWRLTPAVVDDGGFEVSLDATRSETAGNEAAEHGVMLRALLGW